MDFRAIHQVHLSTLNFFSSRVLNIHRHPSWFIKRTFMNLSALRIAPAIALGTGLSLLATPLLAATPTVTMNSVTASPASVTPGQAVTG